MADFRKFQDAMKRSFQQVASVPNMQDFGKQAADMIRLRTRLGYGVSGEGQSRESLKPLSDRYKKQRSNFKNLSGLTSPSKSNLTRTGQMLDSLQVTGAKTNEVTVGPSGSRWDGNSSNSEIGGYVTDAGRPFNFLSNIEKKRIVEYIGAVLQKILRSELTK